MSGLTTGIASFFGTQDGDFSLVVNSISAVKETEKAAIGSQLLKEAVSNGQSAIDEKGTADSRRGIEHGQQNTGLLGWLSTMCIVS